MTPRQPSPPALGLVPRDAAGDWHHAFKARAVETANRLRSTIKGDFVEVRRLVDGHDLVFGVWRDPEEPNGVGMLIVKGHQLMRETIAAGAPLAMTWTAIPCVEGAQAEALRMVAGESDRRH